MSDSLADLEGRRANVPARIAQLGDLRSGSITLNPAVPCAATRHLLCPQWHASPMLVTITVNCGAVGSEANKGRICAARDSTAGFRITGTGGRCGDAHCHCHRAGDPGHGPYYRLTRKADGKTVTETFLSPASLAKAQREVAEYHRFRELSGQLLEVNEQICGLRPVEETASSAQEKKRRKQSARTSRGK